MDPRSTPSPSAAPAGRDRLLVDRRRLLTLLAVGAGMPLVLPVLAACGADHASPGGGGVPAEGDVARVVSSRLPVTAEDLAAGGRLLSRFTGEMLGRLATTPGNLVCSPYSMALALAMTREGALGTTADQMDQALGSSSAAELDAALNAAGQTLAARVGTRKNSSEKDASVALEVACSLFGQQGVVWKQPFLRSLSAAYGAGVELVDYRTAAPAAGARINAWVSAHTAGLIPHLLPDGAVDESTRLVLVNALHLKAPWHHAFDEKQTSPGGFRLGDGTSVDVPMMSASDLDVSTATGTGWRGVSLPYAGKELAMTLLLPDEGREAELVASLRSGLATVLAAFRPDSGRVVLPKFSMRWGTTSVRAALQDLGMVQAFTDRADFSGMTDELELLVDDVLHQATIVVDEAGTEAAAATAVTMVISSARADPFEIVLDRPFLYVVHDVATGIPLFVGRVSDPR